MSPERTMDRTTQSADQPVRIFLLSLFITNQFLLRPKHVISLGTSHKCIGSQYNDPASLEWDAKID
eukprot:scaffold1983_cov165-Amphora_coffeaeformis.AAC.6